ncbi:MAG: sulfotransferase family protein [Bacteroidota bacterium]|jgi:hypothetical protein
MLEESIDKKPIHFIVSTGRTGSTLLSTMLNAHPQIISLSEQPFTLNLIDGYINITKWNNKIKNQFIDDFFLFATDKLSTQFSDRVTLENYFNQSAKSLSFEKAIKLSFLSFFESKVKSDIKIFVSKELIFHTQIKKITSYYPEAKFIILTRDPRDNVQIKINRALRRSEKQKTFRYIAAWNIVYKLLFKDLKKYAPENFIVLKYEDLVKSTEPTLKNICNFLDVTFHEDMLNYDHKNKLEFEERKEKIPKHLMQQLNREHQGLLIKTNTDKIGIWKREMNTELAEKIWNECRHTAKLMGYSYSENESFNSKNKLGINYKAFRFWFYLNNIIIPKIYYKSPFVARRIFKKIRLKLNRN